MNLLFHLGRLANGVARAVNPSGGASRASAAGEECTPCAANAYAEQQAAEAARMLRGVSSSGKGKTGKPGGRR
jgi:hypothetical protein